ncbi:hypothetical protein HYDPIDRAFT_34639, partial [Hydnomerulius pinastri MD-312]
MTDSFADLWASSAPTKPTQPPPKLGAAANTSQVNPTYPRRPQKDAFSILSASQPATRTQSPQIANQTQTGGQAASQRSSNNTTGDAFSGLFSSSMGSLGGGQASTGNMTMAERAALAQKSKVQQYSGASSGSGYGNGGGAASVVPSAWDGLDSLAQTARPAAVSPPQDDFDFAFESAPTTTNKASTSLVDNNDDDWGLSEFSSPQSKSPSITTTTAPTSKPASTSKPQTLWDLDDFVSPSSQTAPSRSQTGTPGDFDFGNREDALLGGDDSDGEDTFGISGAATRQEDDILGDLGKPVVRPYLPHMAHTHTIHDTNTMLTLPQTTSTRPSPVPSPNSAPPAPSSRHPRPPQRTSSPPPHITGQLVEMGFSPQQARTALTSTMSADGFNIQAATEFLLTQGGEGSAGGEGRASPEMRDRERERRARTQGRPRPPRTDSQPAPPGPSQSQTDLTAEKILSQASELGRGMFSKANALWKEGRERAVKMYEERAAVAGSSGGGAEAGRDGRPR